METLLVQPVRTIYPSSEIPLYVQIEMYLIDIWSFAAADSWGGMLGLDRPATYAEYQSYYFWTLGIWTPSTETPWYTVTVLNTPELRAVYPAASDLWVPPAIPPPDGNGDIPPPPIDTTPLIVGVGGPILVTLFCLATQKIM